MMIYDLLIQIVNYNTKGYLIECLDGLIKDLKDTEINYKIVVLDNNSNDELNDLVVKYKKFNIDFYFSDKNLGFGGGHNLLSKKENSKYLLLVNPDIKFIENRTIDRLFGFINSNLTIKVIGPSMITDNRNEDILDHGELSGFRAWLSYNLGSTFMKPRNKKIICAWTCGAFFMVDRESFERVNGFDENFFLFVEEEDLCLRIRENKGKVVYYPYVKILHHSSVVAKKSEHYEKSHQYYIKKHFENKITFKILKAIRSVYRMFK